MKKPTIYDQEGVYGSGIILCNDNNKMTGNLIVPCTFVEIEYLTILVASQCRVDAKQLRPMSYNKLCDQMILVAFSHIA